MNCNTKNTFQYSAGGFCHNGGGKPVLWSDAVTYSMVSIVDTDDCAHNAPAPPSTFSSRRKYVTKEGALRLPLNATDSHPQHGY